MKVRCVGFAFTEDRGKVLLVKKSKPKWQAGKLNGVGGIVGDCEHANDAIARECGENTGLMLPWRWYCTIEYPHTVLYAYRAFSDNIREAMNIVGKQDPVVVMSVNILRTSSMHFVDDLSYLIPMALNDNINSASIWSEWSIESYMTERGRRTNNE